MSNKRILAEEKKLKSHFHHIEDNFSSDMSFVVDQQRKQPLRCLDQHLTAEEDEVLEPDVHTVLD